MNKLGFELRRHFFGQLLQCIPFFLYFLQHSFFLSQEQFEQLKTAGTSIERINSCFIYLD